LNIRDLPLSGKLQLDLIQLEQSDSWCRCGKRNYAMSNKRLLDAVECRGGTSGRFAALVLPISNRPRVTSSCTGKFGLREPGEHTSGPNLASRDNVAHNRTLYDSGNAATGPSRFVESRPGHTRLFNVAASSCRAASSSSRWKRIEVWRMRSRIARKQARLPGCGRYRQECGREDGYPRVAVNPCRGSQADP